MAAITKYCRHSNARHLLRLCCHQCVCPEASYAVDPSQRRSITRDQVRNVRTFSALVQTRSNGAVIRLATGDKLTIEVADVP
jgi:hypothetical protein